MSTKNKPEKFSKFNDKAPLFGHATPDCCWWRFWILPMRRVLSVQFCFLQKHFNWNRKVDVGIRSGRKKSIKCENDACTYQTGLFAFDSKIANKNVFTKLGEQFCYACIRVPNKLSTF